MIAWFVRAYATEEVTTAAAWEDLSDEPSRQELFERVVKSKLQDDFSRPLDTPSILSALPQEFRFPDDALYDETKVEFRENTMFGIDISHHTGDNLDFSSLYVQKEACLEKTQQLTERTPVIYTCRSWWRERALPESAIDTLAEYPIGLRNTRVLIKRARLREQKKSHPIFVAVC